MDFYVMDSDTTKEQNRTEYDEVLKTYIKYVDFENLESYLKLPEYNDPLIRQILSARLYPISNNMRNSTIITGNKKMR